MKMNEAKRHVKEALQSEGVEFTKLKGRTVGFSDLARGKAIFVKPVGMKLPDTRIDKVKEKLPKGVILDLPDMIFGETIIE